MKLENENHRQWIDRIQQVYQTGDLALAEDVCSQALQSTNRYPQILEAAGLIAFQKRDFDAAVRLIEEAMFVRRLSFSAQMVLAKAYHCLGKQDQAHLGLNFMVEMVDRVPCSLLPDLTVTAANFENYEAALAVCRHAAHRHPNDDKAFYGAAFYMFKLGYPTPAIKRAVQKALVLNPNCQLYRLTLAVIGSVRRQWTEAYNDACQLSDQSLCNIPHTCFVRPLADLFSRFGDLRRLNLVRQSKSNWEAENE